GLLITLSRGRAFEMLGTCALIMCHLAGLVLLQSDFQSWDIIPTQVPNLSVKPEIFYPNASPVLFQQTLIRVC
ncbi:hypothetical protein PN467_03500, partial [Microcystis aeruginosa CS-563/04]|nr:hypothetical protein [Microcystis aeruginosa CS-563/04]